MGLLSRIFGNRNEKKPVKTTYDHPYRIENPILGFLNLQGDLGTKVMEEDHRMLSPLFKESRLSSQLVPRCQVLLVYATVNSKGALEGAPRGLMALAREARAYIVVLAAEAAGNPDAGAIVGGDDGGWSANIVVVLDRKADKFASFWRSLFEMMFQGESMLMAWVKLAPMIPNYDNPNVPDSFMSAGAGHITFSRSG